MSQAGTLNSNSGPPGNATDFVTDDGTVIPSSDIININGGPGIQVIANPDGSNNMVIRGDVLGSVFDFDDFLIVTSGGDDPSPKLGFTNILGDLDQLPGTVTNPGITYFSNPQPQSDAFLIASDSSSTPIGNTSPFRLGGGALSSNFIMDIGTLSNGVDRYNFYIGLVDTNTLTIPLSKPLNGCFLQYSDNVNSGNWQLVTGSAGVYTTTNTAVPATTGFHNYGVSVNAAGTSVSFFLDGVSLGTIVTNIPTAVSVGPGFVMENILGNIVPYYVDLFYYNLTLTTRRPG